MNDWKESYRDLGREMDAMERGAASMERQMDRLIQEVHDLKQENAALRLEIGRCPHGWCEDCQTQEQYVKSEVASNKE